MQIAEVYDTALVRQKRSESAELATIYDTQGKERQIAEQRAGKRLFTAISIAAVILALLIFAFAVYVFRQWRNTKEKNRVLVDQINEALEYKKKYRELRNKVECRTENVEFATAPEGNAAPVAEANSPLSTLNLPDSASPTSPSSPMNSCSSACAT
jgi:uncharacterized protein HemX